MKSILTTISPIATFAAPGTTYNEQVRTAERGFGKELFHAFVADYNDAR